MNNNIIIIHFTNFWCGNTKASSKQTKGEQNEKGIIHNRITSWIFRTS